MDRRSSPQNAVWLALCVALVVSRTAAAHDQAYAFALADRPTTDRYWVELATSYHDGGDRVFVERLGTGRYAVQVGDTPAVTPLNGTLQVSAYGNTANYCKVRDWFWTSSRVDVDCYSAEGAPADTAFTLLYLLPDAHPNPFAYALAIEPTSPSYSPAPHLTYNGGTSNPVTVTRHATGTYTVHWQDFDLVSDGWINPLVTAYGHGNESCHIESAAEGVVDVACFTPAGLRVDAAFFVQLWQPNAGDPGVALAAPNPPAYGGGSDPFATYNPTGGSVSVTVNGVGDYTVVWGGVGSVGIGEGHVQVTGALDPLTHAPVRCSVAEWDPDRARVRCHDFTGASVDALLAVLFLKPPKKSWTQAYAYTAVEDPFSPTSTPDPALSFNFVSEDPVEVTRHGPGQYTVYFPGLEVLPGGGNVQVSQIVGTGHCQIATWSASAVNVRCYDDSGSYADQLFQVLFLKSQPGTTATFYAWANDPTAATYAPHPIYAFHPTGGAMTARRTGVGQYSMEWEDASDFGDGGGHVQVTAYGLSPRSCHVAVWTGDVANVRCYDAAGALADSAYAILYLRPDAEDAALAFTWGNQSTSATYSPNSLYTFNSADDAVTIDRNATGYYEVHFGGFSVQGGPRLGHVQVSSYGSAAVDCDTPFVSWDTVIVECLDVTGSPVDTRFDLLYLRPLPLPEPSAFVGAAAGAALLMGLVWRRRLVSRKPGRSPRSPDSAPRTAGSPRANG